MKEKGLRPIAIVMTLALVIMMMISLLVLRQRDIALSNELMAKATSSVAISNVATAQIRVEETQRQATIARADELASQSLYVQDKDLPASFLLGIEAYKTFDTPLTRNSLLQGAEYQPQLLHFLVDGATSDSELAFSSDSKILAVAGCEKTNESGGCAHSAIRFWNVSNGQPTESIITARANIVFSPDRKTFALGNDDGSVMIRDAATLQMIGQPLKTSDASGTSSLVFSPDGKILASETGIVSNGDVGPINLWDVASQKLIGSLHGIPFGPHSLAFSSDGKTLLYLGWTNELIGWNVATQTRVKESQFRGNQPGLGETALSADGKIAAFAPFRGEGEVQEGGIIVWDTTTGKPIDQTLVGFSNLCGRSLAFSPDSKTLASGCSDGTIILWDLVQSAYVMNPEQLTGHPLKGHTGAVWSLTFSPDGKTLASSGDDGTVILWSVTTQTPLGQQFKVSSGWLNSVTYSPDGKIIATGATDGTITFWDATSRQQISAPIKTHDYEATSVAFSPDGRMVAVGSFDGTINFWDVDTHRQVGPTLIGNSDVIYSLGFSPDGKTIAAGDFDHTVLLWNVATGELIGAPFSGHTDQVNCIAFTPDGKILASGGVDNMIVLWNVATHQMIGRPLTGHSDYVLSLAFSPDGTTLASGSRDENIILWDTTTWQPFQKLHNLNGGSVFSLAFSPDGKTLASGDSFDSIKLWDVETFHPIGNPLIASKAVSSIAFSPDGRTLASGSWDGMLTFWDLEPQDWIENSCQRAGRNLTQAEWDQYFPGEPYSGTCPEWPAGIEATQISTPTASP